DVLLNPARLYPMLDAATSSLTTDPDLASLRGLYDLVRGMRNIPTERVQFLTVPRTSYVYNANRDQLVKPAADKLFALLRTDAPVAVAKDLPTDSQSGLPTDPASGHDSAFDYEEESRGNGKSRGKRPDAPTSAPTFRGNTAAEDACG
ncbi:LytR family transcriptional regulator, partial [Streptomyces sp. NPDC057927]